MTQMAELIFDSIRSGKMDELVGAQLLKQLKLQELATPTHSEDMAIIGMSLKLPDANDVDQFWSNLRSGVDSIAPFPESRRKDVEPLIQYTYMRDRKVTFCEAGYLDEIDKFDYKFFNISPKEASLMDPNQRLFLQTAWNAIEDAGYGGEQLTGSRTGLFIGYSGWPMYGQFVSYVEPESFDISVSGNISAIMAKRLHQYLDLKGPSMLVDTACSSSLVALHQACQSIKNGDCEQALVGGIRLLLLPVEGFIKYGIESHHNRTKSFDDDADGTILSEGIAAIMIKPLSKALQDGDHIDAVIKGSAINQDGRSVGITAPNALAQEDVMIRAWQNAKVEPETISYIEAMGSGTQLGDPIEIDGIQKAFRKYTSRQQFCAIGSVKTNIGHTDSTSGLAGVIKCVLSMQHRELPPTLHFERPNRNIRLEQSPVYINDQLNEWEANGKTRRCGISSFGFSGTNGHIVLEEAPGQAAAGQEEAAGPESLYLLPLSAKSETSLSELIRKYAGWLEQKEQLHLRDMCYTAATGRGHYSYRAAILFRSLEDLQQKLNRLVQEGLAEDKEKGIFYGSHHARTSGSKGNPSSPTSLLRELNEEELVRLCDLYIGGSSISWSRLYEGESRKKMRLPVYSFDRHRCWMNIPEAKKMKNMLVEEIDFEF